MHISEELACLFSATVDEQRDSYVIEVPRSEVEDGFTDTSQTYQVALLSTTSESSEKDSDSADTDHQVDHDRQEPPVDVGEHRIVEITEIGDQGDGLTRVERGFVVIVPETQQGERVRIQIETVKENVAFAEVVERFRY
jgi:predicted RNA-binding protein with TRAM domain